jgi:hypothetical protein
MMNDELREGDTVIEKKAMQSNEVLRFCGSAVKESCSHAVMQSCSRAVLQFCSQLRQLIFKSSNLQIFKSSNLQIDFSRRDAFGTLFTFHCSLFIIHYSLFIPLEMPGATHPWSPVPCCFT